MAKARGFPPSRVGLPVSLRLALPGFHPSRSYSLSAGFKYRQSGGMYVPSGVHVSIMDNAAFRTDPLTDIERKRVENMSTVEAPLTGWIPLVKLDKGTSIPLGLIFELGHELR